MKKQNYMSWHTYFMAIAFLSSFRSKDEKTQNGACIVDKNHKIIGIGYNGLPRGCDDNDPDYWADNDDDTLRSKHTYVVHAEKNAIYNCMAHDMSGATMYVTQYPCNTCAQAIIQVGIKEVIYAKRKEHHDTVNRAVEKMFADAGVLVEQFIDAGETDRRFTAELERLKKIYE
jgi:dCMP deaminase